MQITIHWQKPIQLTKNRKVLVDRRELPDVLEEIPGVYFFARKHGSTVLPFYIGETLKIRGRLKDHLGRVEIVDVLRGESPDKAIRNGNRYFHYGYLHGNAEKAMMKKRLLIAQKHLIRVALEHQIPILNSNLTKVKTHLLEFTGSAATRAIYDKFSTVEIT